METHDKYKTYILKTLPRIASSLEKIEKKMSDGQGFTMEKHLFGEPVPWIKEEKEIDMDIVVEFAENICDFYLSDQHKEFLCEAYDAVKNNKSLIYITPRGNSRFEYNILQALAVMAVAEDRNLLK